MRRGAGLIIAVLLAAPGLALAAAPRSAFTPPHMTASPSAEDLAALYPTAAARREVSGRVMLGCVLGVDGLLRDCKVVSETPTGLGFGEAALKIAPAFRFSPAARGGRPVELPTLRFPVNFRMEPGAAADIPPPSAQPLPARRSSRLVDGWLQFVLPLIFFGLALLRYPKVRQGLAEGLRWSWRRLREAVERSRTPGEELSAPPRRDPLSSDQADSPVAPQAAPPTPSALPAAGSIVEELGGRARRPGQDGGIVSDAGGWSPFRNRK